jgi:hypothetical protein
VNVTRAIAVKPPPLASPAVCPKVALLWTSAADDGVVDVPYRLIRSSVRLRNESLIDEGG